jgi:predicted metalloprotease with PDZ domain
MFSRIATRSVIQGFSTLALMAAAHAEISYRVTVQPTEKRISVEMTIPAKPGQVAVQIPNWMPGAYAYGAFYETIHDVTAQDGKGSTLIVAHPDKNTWSVNASGHGPVKISYWVSSQGRRRFSRDDDGSYVQISGAATYMYVVGRKSEKCQVEYAAPDGWPIVTGLDPLKGGKNRYEASSYDVLADSPVSTGQILIDQYTLRGKVHTIVLEGAAKSDVDRSRLLRDCRFVSAAETDFFGSIPYHRYVWHFVVYPAPDGAGGLEHLNGTQITLSSGEGQRAQSVLAHEFFHLWNVKRIRASVLGPFDYLTLPKTGALWWLEGVTDYYATLLPYRYGEWKRDVFYKGIVNNATLVENNPAYHEISANEASLRVGDAEGGRGNSNGYKISYYNLGWLGGLCLDTEIRSQTNNRHSLDDVIRAMYELCKDGKPGFEEDEIRNQCIRFGGPSLGPFYDRVILKAGEMPIDDQLAKMGLEFQTSDESFVDIGFTATPVRGGKGLRISKVSDASDGKLAVGDVLTSIAGQDVNTDDFTATSRVMRDLQTKATAGAPFSVGVIRDGQTLSVDITPKDAIRKVRTIVDNSAATSAMIALREGWLKTKKPSVQ